jgi:hypothetical protein
VQARLSSWGPKRNKGAEAAVLVQRFVQPYSRTKFLLVYCVITSYRLKVQTSFQFTLSRKQKTTWHGTTRRSIHAGTAAQQPTSQPSRQRTSSSSSSPSSWSSSAVYTVPAPTIQITTRTLNPRTHPLPFTTAG